MGKSKIILMNKYLKWVIGIVLTPFILIVLLAVALYLPPIQNWAVKTVAAYASKEMGMEVSVERRPSEIPPMMMVALPVSEDSASCWVGL